MNLHKYQLYSLEQHSESFKIWSEIIRINTEGKSLIMKLGPRHLWAFSLHENCCYAHKKGLWLLLVHLAHNM